MILFYHIPKTAGTFIRVKMESVFNSLSLYPIQSQCWMSNHEGLPLEFKCSHNYYLLQSRLQADDYFFTFLRHPVDIIYSRYAYLAKYNDSKKYNILSDSQKQFYEMTIDEHIDKLMSGELKPAVYGKADTKVDFDAFSFVGIVEDMDQSLAVLNKDLGTHIMNNTVINKGPGIDNSYRREDLEKVCEPEIEIFENFREKLAKRVAS